MRQSDVSRILIYSHDTFGLGHLRRCRAIAHSLVERIKKLHVLIVSGSAIAGAFDFRARVDFIKIPGVIKLYNGEYTSLANLIDVSETLELRRSILYSTADIFRPDVMIVDKEPLGLRGELEPTLELLRSRGCRMVLGLREVLDAPEILRAEWARSDALAKINRLYDDIWVYGCPRFWNPLDGLDLPPRLADRMQYMGYLKRNTTEAPHQHAVELPDKFILLTVGGGGDGASVIEQVLAAREYDRTNTFPIVAVLGPFMASEQRRLLRERASRLVNVSVIEFDAHLEDMFRRATAVIAMGGYNTFCEILSFDKPALLIPRVAPRREQLIRAERATELGLIDMLRPLEAADPRIMANVLRALPDRAPPSLSQGAPDIEGLKRITKSVARHLAERKRSSVLGHARGMARTTG